MAEIGKVAIVGAGGFLGTNLARFLKPRVEDLRCYGRRCAFPEAIKGITWRAGDIADTAITDVVADCDVVIHLASTSSPATADKDIAADAAANIVGSLRLFERCAAGGVKRVIFLSSGGTVYGIPDMIPTPESAATDPISAYGVAKLAVEKYLEIFRRRHGLDYRILRVANIYGPYQTPDKGQGVVAAFLRHAIENAPLDIWGNGEIVRDYVFVSDVVEAIWAAMCHTGSPRTFNIGSGTGTSVLQIAQAIEMLTGRILPKNFLPSRPADVPVSILDHALASSELAWKPVVTLPAGLAQMLTWITEDASGQSE